MGLVYANIELLNPDDVRDHRKGKIGEDEIRQLNINMMVDSGSIMLAINEEICEQLGLDVFSVKKSALADGRIIEFPIAGPVEVRFEGRVCRIDALVLPGDNEPLFGAVPMEELDLFLHPAKNLLTVVNPDGAVMMLK